MREVRYLQYTPKNAAAISAKVQGRTSHPKPPSRHAIAQTDPAAAYTAIAPPTPSKPSRTYFTRATQRVEVTWRFAGTMRQWDTQLHLVNLGTPYLFLGLAPASAWSAGLPGPIEPAFVPPHETRAARRTPRRSMPPQLPHRRRVRRRDQVPRPTRLPLQQRRRPDQDIILLPHMRRRTRPAVVRRPPAIWGHHTYFSHEFKDETPASAAVDILSIRVHPRCYVPGGADHPREVIVLCSKSTPSGNSASPSLAQHR